MFRDEKLELKVGLFIGVGIFLMFLIVFSISDFYLLREGYETNVVFDFVNGIKKSAPIRLAGVNVGEVKDIVVFYDEEAGKTRVKLILKIIGDTRIEEDATARINTLGLLGEQYLEITPGRSEKFLAAGDIIQGKDPVNVGMQMEKMTEFADQASSVMRRISEGEGTIGRLLTEDTIYRDLVTIIGRLSSGEGTIGRLLTEDTIYRDLETIIGRLSSGQGTIGKLLVEEDVYDDIEELTSDIKAHPWKLLRVTTDRSSKSDKETRGTIISPRR
jgi:phospholipid/cholesterol/gamma-HCH transport system substrate-binding protein